MPSIVFDKITVTFTNADMPSLIAEMEEFIRRNRPVELFEPKPVPIIRPIPVPEPTPFIGERGELLKKDLSTPEFFAWVQTTDIDDENENWTIAGCNRRIRRCLKELPPKLAAAAREFAKSHKYGRAPDELVAEYLYCRWMSGLESEVHYAAIKIKEQLPIRFHIIDYMDSKLYRCEVFEQRRLELGAKLINEHGWKLPVRNFAGTEFQQIAIDSKNVTFPDGSNIAHELYVTPTSMNYKKLLPMINDDVF